MGVVILLIPFVIFTIFFLGTSIFNVLRGATHDRRAEWLYFCILSIEKKLLQRGNSMESCLLSTALPYYLGRLLHIQPSILFYLIPAAFQALIPTFAYLITYLFTDNILISLVATLFTISNYFFLRDPNLGRVSIGNGIIAGIIWAVVTKNIVIAVILSSVLPLAYYGASYYSIVLLLVASLAYTEAIAALVSLAISLFIYHAGVARVTGKQCIKITSGTIQNKVEAVEVGSEKDYYKDTQVAWEPVIGLAFGQGLHCLSFLKKVEWLTSWCMVGLIITGLLTSIWFLPTSYLVFSVTSSLLIVACLFNKVLSRFYGVPRAYFTALPILAPLVATIPSIVPLLVISAHFIVVFINTITNSPVKVIDNWQKLTYPSWKEVMEKTK